MLYFICPATRLEGIGINSTSILEILSGTYAGTYAVDEADNNSLVFQTSPTEPIPYCNRIF
jgi:hypothetical protein